VKTIKKSLDIEILCVKIRFTDENLKAMTERKISSINMPGDAGAIEILRMVQAGVDGYVNTLPSRCFEPVQDSRNIRKSTVIRTRIDRS